MIFQNLRMALSSIGRNKLRSSLTMLGMIIGIAAVITVLSIGEGLKAQVQGEVKSLGVDLITINPQPDGKPLTTKDYELVQKSNVLSKTAPLIYLTANPFNGTKKSDTAVVVATTPDFGEILSQKVQRGRFFDDRDKDVVVIGTTIATDLFGTEDPIGKKIVLKQEVDDPVTLETKTIEKTFTVVGVFDKKSAETSFGPGAQLNTTLYIPFASSKFFTNNATTVDEINARAKSTNDLGQTKTTLINIVKKNHKDTEDFTIETSEDISKSFNDIFGVVTSFIAAIAAISLLVGGIGIMNIMLTSVTERTREIGIRKSIGASQTIILIQFLTEALVLTLVGGLLGILAAYGLSFLIKMFADITPVFGASSFVIAVGVSVLIGVVFGTFPAVSAARKKPIDALRHE